MLTKCRKMEMTMKKVKMGERWNGAPEECWVARIEVEAQQEAKDDEENDEERSGLT